MEETKITKEEIFEYTYSAKRQEEIEAIKNKYLPKEEDKLLQLRKMDACVTMKAALWAICVGMIGMLTFGGGMSCVLVGTKEMFVPGIVLGLLGLAIMGLALPIHKMAEKREREKIAPQIIALAEELSE